MGRPGKQSKQHEGIEAGPAHSAQQTRVWYSRHEPQREESVPVIIDPFEPRIPVDRSLVTIDEDSSIVSEPERPAPSLEARPWWKFW